MALLEFDALGVDIGAVSALGNLRFRIVRGQLVGIAGAAGSGKTTLALALAGLLPAEAQVSGRILFEDDPLPTDAPTLDRIRGNRLGYLFGEDRAALDPHRPIGRQATPEALTAVGLDAAVAAAYADDLTAGERRLVLLARAIAREPDIVVADDPARGLDPVAGRRVLDALIAAARARNMALLLLVRDPRLLVATCQEAMILRGGRIVEAGAPSQIVSRPQHDYTRAFLSMGNVRTRTLQRPALGDPLLSVSGLAAGPLRGIGFEVRRGEAVALVGGERSGKTALARIVAGLDRAPAGRLVIEHDPYRGDDLPLHRRREIAYVPANPGAGFDPALPVGASLMQPLRLEPQLTLDEQTARLLEHARVAGLSTEVLSLRPAGLGEETLLRLALARALIGQPRLLVVDDLAERLDVAERNQMLVQFSRIRSDYGLSVLMLTRDIEAARAVADRALILADGQIVEEGRPQDLVDAPVHAATAAMVRARLPEIVLPQGPTRLG